MDRGAWWAIAHGIAKSWTWLSTHTYTLASIFKNQLFISNLEVYELNCLNSLLLTSYIPRRKVHRGHQVNLFYGWILLFLFYLYFMTAFYLHFCFFHLTCPIPTDSFSKKNGPLPGEIRVYTLKVKVKVTQSSRTLCNPIDYTVHGIFQARILEWIAIPFSRGSSQPRDWTLISRAAGDFFTIWPTREALTP